MVTDKINNLEDSLKKTQKSEKKLVETLNYMMAKYEEETEDHNRGKSIL